MPRLRAVSLSSCLPIVLSLMLCHAAELPRRAEPPRWSQGELDTFFDDARDQLVGSRPQPVFQAEGEQLAAHSPGGPSRTTSASRSWSELIRGETLTAEIKRINNQLATALKTSASFQSGGNLLCQRDFGLLAVLFGIVAEFEEAKFNQSERWQSSAKIMQSRCFQTGQDCQTASAVGYAAAQETHAMLEELIRGQLPTGGGSISSVEEQPVVDLTDLMQSLELALKQRISPALANVREFRRRSQVVSQQAQLLAALAEVVQQAGYEYTDDDTYLDEAWQLREAARELAEAAREKNYEAGRAAAGRVSQSCSRCHEGFRG